MGCFSRCASALAAACSLSHRDVEVLLLEASSPGHEMAGSKGSARIFRMGYPDPLYVEMAVGALAQWQLLENETGLDLLTTTGQLSFGPDAAAVTDAMEQVGMEFEQLTAAEAADRFPALHASGPVLFEPESGVLAADQCLRAILASGQFTLDRDQPVVALEDTGGEVHVLLRDGRLFSAEVVVNCAGPNALDLVSGLRCARRRPATWQQVVYLGLDPDEAAAARVHRMGARHDLRTSGPRPAALQAGPARARRPAARRRSHRR